MITSIGGCLRVDLQAGRRQLIVAVALGAGLALLETGGIWLKAASVGVDWGSFSLGDNVLALLCGMIPPQRGERNDAAFPVGWLLLWVACLYAPLAYPSRDTRGFGRSVALECESRRAWFLAKCLWTAVAVLLFLGGLLATEVGLTALTSGNLSFTAEEVRPVLGLPRRDDLQGAPYEIGPFVATCVPVCIAFSVLIMTLSLFVRPLISFSVALVLLVLPALAITGWLPGEYLMAARSETLMATGFSVGRSLLYSAAMLSISIAGGCALFDRADLLGRSASDD